MTLEEWLLKAEAQMDYSGYHPDKDFSVPALTALRDVFNIHTPVGTAGSVCSVCFDFYPCATIRAISDAIGIESLDYKD